MPVEDDLGAVLRPYDFDDGAETVCEQALFAVGIVLLQVGAIDDLLLVPCFVDTGVGLPAAGVGALDQFAAMGEEDALSCIAVRCARLRYGIGAFCADYL